MNQNLISQALELQKKGLSIRQIAAELNVSKSQVFRWLNGQSGNGGNNLPIDQIAIASNTPQSLKHKNQNNMENNNDLNKLEREIALKKLQLEHELELRKSDMIISYEYDDDSIEFLEILENCAFFS